MRTTGTIFAVCFVLFAASAAMCLEGRAFQIRDDFGMEPLDECALNYYYYTPCPSYAWWWAMAGWSEGDIVGSWFQVGDLSMSGLSPCDPAECHSLFQFRVLDFAGYGIPYPTERLVEFDIYCSNEYGCPIGPSLWNSGAVRLGYAWNYFTVDPPLSICGCSIVPGGPTVCSQNPHYSDARSASPLLSAMGL